MQNLELKTHWGKFRGKCAPTLCWKFATLFVGRFQFLALSVLKPTMLLFHHIVLSRCTWFAVSDLVRTGSCWSFKCYAMTSVLLLHMTSLICSCFDSSLWSAVSTPLLSASMLRHSLPCVLPVCIAAKLTIKTGNVGKFVDGLFWGCLQSVASFVLLQLMFLKRQHLLQVFCFLGGLKTRNFLKEPNRASLFNKCDKCT